MKQVLLLMIFVFGLGVPLQADGRRKSGHDGPPAPHFDFDHKDSLSKSRNKFKNWIKDRVEEGHHPDDLMEASRRNWENYLDRRRTALGKKHGTHPDKREQELRAFDKDAKDTFNDVRKYALEIKRDLDEEAAREEDRRIRKTASDMSRDFKDALARVEERREAAEEGELSDHLRDRLLEQGLDQDTLDQRRREIFKNMTQRRDELRRRVDKNRTRAAKELARGQDADDVRRSMGLKSASRPYKSMRDFERQMRMRGYSTDEIREMRPYVDN